MEREMANLQGQYKMVEQTYGQDVLNLVLARGYLAKLLENKQVVQVAPVHQRPWEGDDNARGGRDTIYHTGSTALCAKPQRQRRSSLRRAFLSRVRAGVSPRLAQQGWTFRATRD